MEVTGLLQFVSGLRRQIGGKKRKVGVEILLHIVSGLERQSHGNLRLSPTLTAEAPEIKYLWCSLSSFAYKTTRVCVHVEDSGRCAAASKASFRVAVYRSPSCLLFVLPYAPLHTRQKGSNGLGAGVGSAKHPVFLGSSFIDIPQTSCKPGVLHSFVCAVCCCLTFRTYSMQPMICASVQSSGSRRRTL